MNIVILQHIAIEHPGVLSQFFSRGRLSLDNSRARRKGETIPDLDPFDLMVVMGGPQDVWQEDQYPLVP